MKSIHGYFTGKVFTPQQEVSSLFMSLRHQNYLILCCLSEAGDDLKCLTAGSAAPLTSTGFISEHSQLVFSRKIFCECSHPTTITLLSQLSNVIVLHYSLHHFQSFLFRRDGMNPVIQENGLTIS